MSSEPNGNDTDQGAIEDLHELVIKGEAQRVTLDQLKADAQKARAVLPELQSEHDRLKTDHEDLTAKSNAAFGFIQDFEHILKGGEEGQAAIQRLSKALSMSPAEVVEAIAANDPSAGRPRKPPSSPPRRFPTAAQGSDDDENDDALFGDESTQDAPPKSRKRLSLDDLDPELRKDLQYAKSQRLKGVRESMYEDLQSAFDVHPKISTIVDGNPKAAKVVQRLGRTALQRRVNLEDADYGPRLISEIVKEIEQTLDDLGIHSPEAETPSLTGFGLGPADTEFYQEELHREQPPERVSVASGDYRKSFATRLLRKLVKAGGIKHAEDDSE